MDSKQFLEEARKLARPCVDLTRDESAPLAAVWGGAGLVENRVAPSCRTGGFRHWLSLDCRFLPPGYEDVRGCLSVYIEEDQWKEGDARPEDEEPDEWPAIVARDENLRMPESVEGTKLFAHPNVSWPWIDAIFRFGSPAVKEWMANCGWQGDWPYNDNFRDNHIVEDYEEFLRQRDPYFGEVEQVYARLGGWHLPWPDGDWGELLDKELVAMTYRDAEPWLEVWMDIERNFEVLERIT